MRAKQCLSFTGGQLQQPALIEIRKKLRGNKDSVRNKLNQLKNPLLHSIRGSVINYKIFLRYLVDGGYFIASPRFTACCSQTNSPLTVLTFGITFVLGHY